MTQYVRPMDLHSHNGGCELYGCIPVVPADEHNTALGKLDTIRKLVTGLPPTGDPVLIARWLVDDLKEAAK